MHYHAEVYVRDTDNLQEQVARIMAPFKEREDGSYDKRRWWDWYVLDGRWRSVSGLPTTIKNAKDELTCFTLMIGECVLHQEVFVYNEEEPDKSYHRQLWDGKVKPILDSMGLTEGYLVTVDYHR
ncbi:hypothetical protein LCGC14_0370090 [marine sediment metagenome]|uniref:Uncharacterized protein n=1 Tax=marine sediment metagenome TaxID=412755 RepID=A0A0F9T5J1_9ZZZZ